MLPVCAVLLCVNIFTSWSNSDTSRILSAIINRIVAVNVLKIRSFHTQTYFFFGYVPTCALWKMEFHKKRCFFPHKNICRNIRVFMLWFIAPNNIYLRCFSHTHMDCMHSQLVKWNVSSIFLSIILHQVASYTKANDLNKGCTFPIIYSHLVASLYARQMKMGRMREKELNSMS